MRRRVTRRLTRRLIRVEAVWQHFQQCRALQQEDRVVQARSADSLELYIQLPIVHSGITFQDKLVCKSYVIATIAQSFFPSVISNRSYCDNRCTFTGNNLTDIMRVIPIYFEYFRIILFRTNRLTNLVKSVRYRSRINTKMAELIILQILQDFVQYWA